MKTQMKAPPPMLNGGAVLLRVQQPTTTVQRVLPTIHRRGSIRASFVCRVRWHGIGNARLNRKDAMKSTFFSQAHWIGLQGKTTGNPRGEPLANHGQTGRKPAPLLTLAKTTGTPPSYAHTCAHARMRPRARTHVPYPYLTWCESYQMLGGGFPVVSARDPRGFSGEVGK